MQQPDAHDEKDRIERRANCLVKNKLYRRVRDVYTTASLLVLLRGIRWIRTREVVFEPLLPGAVERRIDDGVGAELNYWLEVEREGCLQRSVSLDELPIDFRVSVHLPGEL